MVAGGTSLVTSLVMSFLGWQEAGEIREFVNDLCENIGLFLLVLELLSFVFPGLARSPLTVNGWISAATGYTMWRLDWHTKGEMLALFTNFAINCSLVLIVLAVVSRFLPDSCMNTHIVGGGLASAVAVAIHGVEWQEGSATRKFGEALAENFGIGFITLGVAAWPAPSLCMNPFTISGTVAMTIHLTLIEVDLYVVTPSVRPIEVTFLCGMPLALGVLQCVLPGVAVYLLAPCSLVLACVLLVRLELVNGVYV